MLNDTPNSRSVMYQEWFETVNCLVQRHSKLSECYVSEMRGIVRERLNLQSLLDFNALSGIDYHHCGSTDGQCPDTINCLILWRMLICLKE